MSKIPKDILDWLLQGDVAIQHQVKKDLLLANKSEVRKLQSRIEKEGWGKHFLEKRLPNGYWGNPEYYYQPKWISTHYTLLDLRNLEIRPDQAQIQESLKIALKLSLDKDGGLNISRGNLPADVCVNGMILNFASYFQAEEKPLNQIVDYLLKMQMSDGGYNCSHYRGGKKSSVHSTLTVLEGLLEFKRQGHQYRLSEIEEAEKDAQEVLLKRHIFKSMDGEKILDHKMTMLSHPDRWKLNVLRALDYFRKTELPWDDRMNDALEIVLKKRRSNGSFPVQAKHTGEVHFDMEKTGSDSRWNTLRALRVLKFYEKL